MLAWTVYLSFLGVLVLIFVPPTNLRAVRAIALLSALGGLFCAFAAAITYNPESGIVPVCKVSWVPALGIGYFLGVDGISLTLVLLTGIAAVVGILFSWNIEHRANEFFAFYLALIGGVYGVFISFDLFLLFVFYELAIIPKYFLIAIWGSTNREYGAMKLVLYSFVGSAMVLIGLVAAYAIAGAQTGTYTFNLIELAKVQFPQNFQYWAFPLVFVGFAILAGLWPFHTWAPTGHVAAPTAASMLLAGVVMKLGAYGALRVSMTLFPQGLAAWRDEIAILAVIGIVYGALVAFVQRDFKFVIGYSSVSHMGFVLLGLMTLTTIGLSGAVLQMFSHGIIAGLLFAVVGRMVYDRTHTRELGELEPMQLNRAIPFAAFTFVVAGLASMGMPGFSGFIAELQVLIGAWHAFPTLAVICGIGIIIGVAYTLRAIQKSFYSGNRLAGTLVEGNEVWSAGSPARPASQSVNLEEGCPRSTLEAISIPERIGAVILIAATVVIGLYPPLLLNLIKSGFNSPLMAPLVKGGPL